MSLIDFPNIPSLPGVPALRRSVRFPPTLQVGLGMIQGALWRAFQVDTRWGIYDSNGKALGNPSLIDSGFLGGILEAFGLNDSTPSTSSVDYSKEMRVSNFPVERGGFAAYNKVETPACPVVTLAMGGSESDRAAFLDEIAAACLSTDLYSVVTPEVTYAGYTIERFNYQRRSNRGATLLLVEIGLGEVRQVSAQYTKAEDKVEKPKDVSATPSSDSGKVQPQIPGASTLKSLADKAPALAEKAMGYINKVLP